MGLFKNAFKKQNERRAKAQAVARSKVAALPKVPRVLLSPGYVNPITLNFPKGSIIIYEITNRRTGRKDYFDKDTFWKLARHAPNNYWLLMADPKKPLGFKNPTTRSNVYPRNVRRVTVAAKKKTPSPKTAAKKIQSAVRKHISKKKAKTVKKPSPPKKRQRETGRAGSQRVSK
jgi:hypothetical protein